MSETSTQNHRFYEGVISRQSHEKRDLSNKIQSHVDQFIARGGKIKHLPPQNTKK